MDVIKAYLLFFAILLAVVVVGSFAVNPFHRESCKLTRDPWDGEYGWVCK